MKNKKAYLVVLILITFLLTGCGSNDYIKNEDGNIVINDVTGQNLQKDIFCKPSKDTETYNIYEKYEDQMTIKLSDLPECSEFGITTNSTKSIWQFLFVKPLAWCILKLGNIFKGWGFTSAYLGIALIVVGLIIRLIILPFNLKTQNQSKNMQKLQPEIQKLEYKYRGRDDQESMMMKAQETMDLYKKYKINPLSSCLIALIQLPVFFAFLQAIYKIPTIYEGEIFGWNLGTTPSVGIFTNHNYTFIILIVLIALTTFFSFRYTMKQSATTATTPDAGNQMNVMLYVLTGVITFTSFSLPTAIALYWIVTYAFIIIQTFVVNLINKKKEQKEIKNKKGNIKQKLKMKEKMKYGKNN